MPSVERTASVVTAAEAAVLLKISRRATTKAIVEGRIEAEKLPGRTGSYLIKLSEVRRFDRRRRAHRAHQTTPSHAGMCPAHQGDGRAAGAEEAPAANATATAHRGRRR